MTDGLESAVRAQSTQSPGAALGGEAQAIVPRRKIAILGSSSDSLVCAPWNDPSWSLWGCSGATHAQMKRHDSWFELHDYSSCMPLWSPEYIQFLRTTDRPVFMHDVHPEIPASIAFPRDELINTFGRFFFTSSIAWMLAYALTLDPDEIGLWGVDMAADGEYAEQRPGCHHFITAALHRGIKIQLPLESSLGNPPPLYGCAPRNPLTVQAIALTKRIAETRASMQEAFESSTRNAKYWEGFDDCNKLWLRNLEQDPRSVVGG
jgi:hypothetical protein